MYACKEELTQRLLPPDWSKLSDTHSSERLHQDQTQEIESLYALEGTTLCKNIL